jgi:hypothetical protein
LAFLRIWTAILVQMEAWQRSFQPLTSVRPAPWSLPPWLTMDATFRSTSSSRTASADIVRSVAWMIRTEFVRPASVRSAKKQRTRAGVRDRNRTEPTTSASTWGWIHLVGGIVGLAAGFGVSGAAWARWLGILIAAISVFVNFTFIPFALVGLNDIFVDLWVIHALFVHRRLRD